MIADKDPVVARALDLLVPPLRCDAEELLAQARVVARRRRSARRRRRWVAGMAFAAVALLTGAAIAASRLNLLPFLQTRDANTARYSVDQTRVYRAASPSVLHCASTGTGTFACTPKATGPGVRGYLLVTRAVAQPELTRGRMLARLAAAEHNGTSRPQVQRVRAELAGVSDEFIRSLNAIVSVVTIATDQPVPGHPSLELVPPASVPTWVACAQQSTRTFGCRNLAASTNVPAGTPIYRLQPSKDWHVVTRPQGQPLDIGRLVNAVLGRQPTQQETKLLLGIVESAARGSSANGGTPTVTGHS
jgi:hypothetical protein